MIKDAWRYDSRLLLASLKRRIERICLGRLKSAGQWFGLCCGENYLEDQTLDENGLDAQALERSHTNG
ncbi:hypothetical protein [Desulfomonile tiedjei]|uniref:hypothetical protein n=1 Tax=Desulfomonile tiedjei TaxID=2358 RepID=UPI00059CC390|nr:hypothetical protein [Desulfomonile tiedjei]